MSIIKQLAQIESRANTYNNQKTMHIFLEHPVAGASKPYDKIDVRLPYENDADKSNALLLLNFLKEKGICAAINLPNDNLRNFKFLPREK